MTDPAPSSIPAPLPLFSRIIGIITSPKATFQNIVAAPRPMGILFIVAIIIGLGSIAPQFTEKGRAATVETQVKAMERFGAEVTPDIRARMEERSHSVPLRLLGMLGPLIVLPILALLFAAIYWAAFNVALGGTASFKQVLAVETHAQVISAVGILAALPILLNTGMVNFAGPYNLGALAPNLEAGPMSAFLGSISVFTLWQIVVVAIGLGVLYRRNSRNIAIVLIGIFLLIMFGIASAFWKFMGTS